MLDFISNVNLFLQITSCRFTPHIFQSSSSSPKIIVLSALWIVPTVEKSLQLLSCYKSSKSRPLFEERICVSSDFSLTSDAKFSKFALQISASFLSRTHYDRCSSRLMFIKSCFLFITHSQNRGFFKWMIVIQNQVGQHIGEVMASRQWGGASAFRIFAKLGSLFLPTQVCKTVSSGQEGRKEDFSKISASSQPLSCLSVSSESSLQQPWNGEQPSRWWKLHAWKLSIKLAHLRLRTVTAISWSDVLPEFFKPSEFGLPGCLKNHAFLATPHLFYVYSSVWSYPKGFSTSRKIFRKTGNKFVRRDVTHSLFPKGQRKSCLAQPSRILRKHRLLLRMCCVSFPTWLMKRLAEAPAYVRRLPSTDDCLPGS